jgi:hypothetical protein
MVGRLDQRRSRARQRDPAERSLPRPLVFNRTRRTYDPDSRKKRIQVRPRAQWIERAAPELRIVDDRLWAAVSARRARFDGTRAEQQRRPKRLLSGLVRCGCCGGSYIVIGAEKWGCGNRRQRGDCSNGRTIQTHMLERRVLAGLQEQLLAPDVVAGVVREYHLASQARQNRGGEGPPRRRAPARRRAARRAPAARGHRRRVGVRRDPRRAGPGPGGARVDRDGDRQLLGRRGDRAAPGNRGRVPALRRRASRAARGSGRGPRLRGPSADPVADRPGRRVARRARARHVHRPRGTPGGDPRPRRRGAGFRSV